MFHQGKMQEARAKLHHDMQHFVNEVTAEELDEIIKHMENCAVLAQALTVSKYMETALSDRSALLF